MLTGMIRVNHLVLNGNIISSKQEDSISTGMVETLEIVNSSIDDYLCAFNVLQGLHGAEGSICIVDGVILFAIGETMTESALICVRCHCTLLLICLYKKWYLTSM